MEILLTQNSVFLNNVNLGKVFSNMVADLTVDIYGRVKVFGSRLAFHTTLNCLPSELLIAISETLKKEADNKILTKIEKRIESTLNANNREEC
jgi:hypothetical protein